MKLAIIYYSKTGTTEKMAKKIEDGMKLISDVDVRSFSIGSIDETWVKESNAVVLGSPTYYADVAGEMKMFMETIGKYELNGKIGGAFATAGYIHGGAEIAIQSMLTHMMFFGMMVYSGGCACGNPPIHLGPVFVDGQTYDVEAVFREYGKRIAQQAVNTFVNDKK